MAFRDLVEKILVPLGASERYRRFEALEAMYAGELYKDLRFPFHSEKSDRHNYIPLRERRPSHVYNLPYLIVSETQGELFGDEQFPYIRLRKAGKMDPDASTALGDLVEACRIDEAVFEAYEEGNIGSCAVVIRCGDDGMPFYEVLPGKWLEPTFTLSMNQELAALTVTYPIDADRAAEEFGIKDDKADHFWYRYILGPAKIVEYIPLPDHEFERLGEKRANGETIEFSIRREYSHDLPGRVPAVYVKNLGGKRRLLDGMATWWPIVDLCVEIDYTLSQEGRGLRYAADPMLFVRQGDLMSQMDVAVGSPAPAGGMAEQMDGSGGMVRGVTQVLVGNGQGSDAKLLEISAGGLTEEREFVKDLRELALEIVGGMKSSAENTKGAQSGAAMKRLEKPLKRVCKRQRRPYGDGLLLSLIDLTLYGFKRGAFAPLEDVNLGELPEGGRMSLEWPSSDNLEGQELANHATALQTALGSSTSQAYELLSPEQAAASLASAMGLHDANATKPRLVSVPKTSGEPTN